MDEQKNIENKIKKLIDGEIKPMLAMDGGDVDFIGFEKGVVTVKLKGACQGCPYSSITVKSGIEETLKKQIKEVKNVETV